MVHPTADATGVSTKAIIRWTPASFAAWGTHTAIYDVEVAHDGNVVCSVLGIKDTTTECNLDPLTEYTVRVRARTEYPSVGSWSEPISFTTYGTPGPTSLLQPEHQATNQPTRPRFIWQKIPWVDKGYEIEYDTIETFTTSTIRERPDTFLVVLSALRQQQTYYWRVRGINEAGKGAWSDVWSFSVAGAVSVQEHHSSPLHLRKELYDVLGRRIINEWLTRGPFIELLIDERGSIVQRRVRTSPD